MYAPKTARVASRTVLLASRTSVRSSLGCGRQLRFATTESATSKAAGSAIDRKALVGGLVGGGLVFLTGYGYYRYSGASTLVSASKTAKANFDSLTSKIQSQAPPPNEALRWLHDTALSYATFVPGAKSYIDWAFKDLEKIQEKHGEEVEKVVNRVYDELKGAAKEAQKKSVVETAGKTWEILEKGMRDIGELASDSVEEIIGNHPQVKQKLGGSLGQLQSLTRNYGGEEAKKELKETMHQVKDIVSSAGTGGLSMETINKVKKLISEKSDKLKQMGEEAWNKGLEQAKPYLDKKPEVKKVVEQNADALKNGNVTEALKQISDAIYSGDTSKLKEYIDSSKEKAKSASNGGGNMASQGMDYAKSFMPTGGVGAEIIPKFQELMKVAENKGGDAEEILKGAWEEVSQVLKKKMHEVEKLAEDAKSEGKEKTKK